MTSETSVTGPAAADDRPLDPRTRRAWAVTAVLGGGTGCLLAGLIAASGGGGRAGFVGFLLGVAFGAAAGALYAVGTAALDTLRGRPVGNSRLWTGAVLFVLAIACTVMLAGLGG